MKLTTTAERLKQIMQERSLRQIDILKLCQPYSDKFKVYIRKNDLSQYISGKVTPRENKLRILSLALNVDEGWLMGYNVPMTGNDSINTLQNSNDKTVNLMLQKFLLLSEHERITVIKFIDNLLVKKELSTSL